MSRVVHDLQLQKAEQQLRRMLDSGQYPPHSKLPPERVLAAKLGVSRGTLRKGLEHLEAEGRLERRQGQGTYVGGRPPAGGTAQEAILVDDSSPAEVFEARLLLEPNVAALAAARAKPRDIDELRHCLERSQSAHDWQTYELWDSTLHFRIAEAAKNSVLCSLLERINRLRQQPTWGRLREASLTRELQQRYSAQHRRIVEAIAERDAHEARRAMRRHLLTVQANLLERPEDLADEVPEGADEQKPGPRV